MPSVSSLSNSVYRALAHEADTSSDLYKAAMALADAVTTNEAPKPVTVTATTTTKPKKKGSANLKPSASKLTLYRRAANTHVARSNSIDDFWANIYGDPTFTSKLAKVVAAAVWASRNSGKFTNDDIQAATQVHAYTSRDPRGRAVHDAYIRACTKAMYNVKVTTRDYVVGTNRLIFAW